MASFRAQRLAEMIHREISVRLRTEIKEPGVRSISITRVQVTSDLSRADISYMPLGGGPVGAELQETMERAGRKLTLRKLEGISFHQNGTVVSHNA